MARDKKDDRTIDIYRDFKPEPVVERFDEDQIRAWSLAGRISKAVAATMDGAEKSRAEIARAMSEFLKEDCSKGMLDQYAAQGKEQHTISAIRLAALVVVTGDARALNTLLEEAGLIAVPKRYEALLRRERARELKERIEREEQAADAEWKAWR